MFKCPSVPGIAVSASMILALTSMPLSERERVVCDPAARKEVEGAVHREPGEGGVWEQPVKLPGESII